MTFNEEGKNCSSSHVTPLSVHGSGRSSTLKEVPVESASEVRLRVLLRPPLSSFSFSASGVEEKVREGLLGRPKKVGSKTKGRGGCLW